MSQEQPTRPDGPNALEVLREAIKLLDECKTQVARSAEQTASYQNGNLALLRMLEETQELIRHGIARALGPVEDRVTRLESRVEALEKVA